MLGINVSRMKSKNLSKFTEYVSTQHPANLKLSQQLPRHAFCMQLGIAKPGITKPLNVGMYITSGFSHHTKSSCGNCNTWAMNVVMNSLHLCLAIWCTFFIEYLILQRRYFIWHAVLTDTITLVVSYIAWRISGRYRHGFSCTIPMINSSWWPSSFCSSSLRCFNICASESGINAICSIYTWSSLQLFSDV